MRSLSPLAGRKDVSAAMPCVGVCCMVAGSCILAVSMGVLERKASGDPCRFYLQRALEHRAL
jgi:hypothetical protein